MRINYIWMKRYIDKSLSVQDINAIRQTQATLSIEGLILEPSDISDFEKLVTGKITREEFQEMIKKIPQSNISFAELLG